MSKYTLEGLGGNAYSVMRYVEKALKVEGKTSKIESYKEKAIAGSYDELLCVSMEVLDELNGETE